MPMGLPRFHLSTSAKRYGWNPCSQKSQFLIFLSPLAKIYIFELLFELWWVRIFRFGLFFILFFICYQIFLENSWLNEILNRTVGTSLFTYYIVLIIIYALFSRIRWEIFCFCLIFKISSLIIGKLNLSNFA